MSSQGGRESYVRRLCIVFQRGILAKVCRCEGYTEPLALYVAKLEVNLAPTVGCKQLLTNWLSAVLMLLQPATCDGTSSSCPDNPFVAANTTVCRNATDKCDEVRGIKLTLNLRASNTQKMSSSTCKHKP